MMAGAIDTIPNETLCCCCPASRVMAVLTGHSDVDMVEHLEQANGAECPNMMMTGHMSQAAYRDALHPGLQEFDFPPLHAYAASRHEHQHGPQSQVLQFY